MEKFSSANPYNPNTKKSPSKKSIITGGLIVLVLLFLIIKVTSGSNSQETDSQVKKYTKEDALAHSQVFIETKLSSPSTAKFDVNTENISQVNDTIFKVRSYVDSQNNFGALVRTKYSCEVIFHPKEDTHDIINALIK